MKTKKRFLSIAILAVCAVLCFALTACDGIELEPPALDANYATLTVGTEATVADLAAGEYKGYKVVIAEAGDYKFTAADGQTFAVGTGLSGTADNVTLTGTVNSAGGGIYSLSAATYYVHVTGNGAFTLGKYVAEPPAPPALDADYATLTVGTEATVADLAAGKYKGYKVTIAEAGDYTFTAAEGQTFAVGTGLDGTADNVTLTGEVSADEGVYALSAATYYVHVTGNGAFTLDKYVAEPPAPPALDADYATLTVGTEATVADLAAGEYKGYKVTIAEAGDYTFAAADGQTFAVGTGLDGTADNVTLTGEVSADEGVYALSATTYYVHVTGNGAFTLDKYVAPHEHSYGDYVVTAMPTITAAGEATATCSGDCTEGHTVTKPLPAVDLLDVSEDDMGDTMTTPGGYTLALIASEDAITELEIGGAYTTTFTVDAENNKNITFITYIMASGDTIKQLPAGMSLLVFVGDPDCSEVVAKVGDDLAAGVTINGGEPVEISSSNGVGSCCLQAEQATANVTIVAVGEEEPDLDENYDTFTVDTEVTVEGLTEGAYKGYKVVISEAGDYVFTAADGQTFAVGTELSGTADDVTLAGEVNADNGVYALSATTYYVHVTGNGAFTLGKYTPPVVDPAESYAATSLNASVTSTEEGDNLYKFTIAQAGLYRFKPVGTAEALTSDDVTLGMDVDADGIIAPNEPVVATTAVYYVEAGTCYVKVTKATSFSFGSYSVTALELGKTVTVSGASEAVPAIYSFTPASDGEYQLVLRHDGQYEQLDAGVAAIGSGYTASTGALATLDAVQGKADTYALTQGTTYYVQFTQDGTYIPDAFNYGAYWKVIEAGQNPAAAESNSSTRNFRFTVSQASVNLIYQIVTVEAIDEVNYTLGESFAENGALNAMQPMDTDVGVLYELEKGKTYYLQVSEDATFKVMQYNPLGKYQFANVGNEFTVAEGAIIDGTAYYYFNSVSEAGNYKLTVTGASGAVKLGHVFDETDVLKPVLTGMDPTVSDPTVYEITEVALFKKYYIEIAGASTSTKFKLEKIEEEQPPEEATPLVKGSNTVSTDGWTGEESKIYTFTIDESTKLVAWVLTTSTLPYYGDLTITVAKDGTIIDNDVADGDPHMFTEAGTYTVTVSSNGDVYGDTTITVEQRENTVVFDEPNSSDLFATTQYILIVEEGSSYTITIDTSHACTGVTIFRYNKRVVDIEEPSTYTITKAGVYTIKVAALDYSDDELAFTVTKN